MNVYLLISEDHNFSHKKIDILAAYENDRDATEDMRELRNMDTENDFYYSIKQIPYFPKRK